jgi:hypothetical protein
LTAVGEQGVGSRAHPYPLFKRWMKVELTNQDYANCSMEGDERDD